MIERLELSIGRLAEIPGEELVPETYRDYFARNASFLLTAVRNEDKSALWQDLLPGEYEKSYANPAFAAACFGREMGQVLSALSAELKAVVPSAAAGDEEGMANLLELFLEIYGDFAGEELPSHGDVRTILRYYVEDYLADQTFEAVAGRVCPEKIQIPYGDEEDDFEAEEGECPGSGRTFREMLEEADLSDPSYLFGIGKWAGGKALALAERYGAMSEAEAESLTEACLAPVLRKLSDTPGIKTIGLMAPSGAERILLLAAGRLEECGYKVTLPRPSVRLSLKNELSLREEAPTPQFAADHREDLALFLDENFISRRKRAAREAYEAFRKEAAVFGGVHFLEIPGEEGSVTPDVAPCPEALSFTPAQAKLAKALARSLEEIRMRYEAVEG